MFDRGGIEAPFLGVRSLILDADGQRLIDIDELSLTSQGITVVMGPNGAGKSLLLRLLHGLVAPTRGLITGGDGALTVETLRKQSLVLQTPVLLRRTTEANVLFVLKVRGLITDRVPDLLARVGLEDKARTPARRLSGGERQRLAIAQALATDPDVLLLDEPTASLDQQSTAVIESILRETVSRGTRVVLVTHDAMQARRLADDVVFLSRGMVAEHTSADQFFDTPKTEQARAHLAGRLNA